MCEFYEIKFEINKLNLKYKAKMLRFINFAFN